ncbi:M4 family metallopeptidase [Hymenobacter properus]|uniref:M4 family metallopeptidase n=1 Tax=Hymenobacter properus TaxID=2791026 RepID=A0A931FL11_9BACT|nr:M4 family metallopeptidase [Hymenobacter properus]MBF9141571.1 M4 family metallopeptidase [Hymenobacter properus]MBR7720380.1 M4 family metallopeptidase [Microvirga sp. SRT04]
MRKQYSAVALTLLGALAATTAHAQDAARIQTKVLGDDKQPVLVQFNAEGKMALRGLSGEQVLRQQLALTNADQMRVARVETDQLGFTHQKFSQYYQGIRVEHADYTVHAKGGTVESISGDFERISGLNTTPGLNESTALSRALAHVGARKYMWQTNEANANEFAPTGELVIVRDMRQGAENGPLVLAWKFNVYAAQPISRSYVYVDAHTGQVVLQDNIIKHAAATGTFATAYSGTRSFADGTTTGGYFLRETTRGLGIQTFNCKKSNSYTSATDFIDADNNWTSAEYNNANFDNVAGDAHVGAQATYDYWKNVHGRNSYDNAGAIIKSYVHFDDVPGGAGYENAYWDGVRMTYGDGATRFRPLTALDVCGHEIGHAVCEKTANLTYANESGAMNEGLSDIWGASIEAYAVANLGFTSGGVKAKSTWLIGEEIDKQQAALRSMSDPKSLGQPAYYKGQYWAPLSSAPSNANDQGGVHTNSGVLNHWYYILAVGKSGTNEGGNTYSVTGQGIDAAAKITFRMESVYMTASSTYAQARTYAIQAATDLYGAGSAQVIAVTDAWYAVGVGASYAGGGTTTPPPTTTTYCTIKGTSQAYEWIDLVQLGSINRTSGKDGGYYNGTALSTSVAAGSSQTMYFSAGFTSTAYTEYWKVYIDYNKNGVFTDAGELVISGSSASSGTLSATFTVPTTARNGSTVMRVIMSDNSATTSCGTFSYGEAEDYTLNITGGAAIAPTTLTGDATPLGNDVARTLELFPNPATDALRLVLPGNAEVTDVTVTDVRGARMTGTTLSNGVLNISGLAKGMYTISVSDGQKVFHQRFVKE